MLPSAAWRKTGVSPKARRNIPRAPLVSRSTLIPSRAAMTFRPPRLAMISPLQLQVLLVYASLTSSRRLACLPALPLEELLEPVVGVAQHGAD